VGAAVADGVDALEGGDDLFVVGDDDDGGGKLAGHVFQQADHGERPFAVQRRGGFVGQDHRRPVDQGAGDGDALLLAAGELRRHGLGAMRDVERVQQFQRPFARFALGPPASMGSRATLSVTSRKGIR
jgi:hypothetical protein